MRSPARPCGRRPHVLQCRGTVYAGAPVRRPVGAGECLRIMTGAVMPAGLDTVVPQELCRADGGTGAVEPGVMRPGENRRRRARTWRAAGRAAAGRVLRPADLGLIGLAGPRPRCRCVRRLRVALFSTGNEVRAPASRWTRAASTTATATA
jgi:molybdopterin molybdotransferase